MGSFLLLNLQSLSTYNAMPIEDANQAEMPGPANRITHVSGSTTVAPKPAVVPSQTAMTARNSTAAAIATICKMEIVIEVNNVDPTTLAETLTHLAYNTNRIPKSV